MSVVVGLEGTSLDITRRHGWEKEANHVTETAAFGKEGDRLSESSDARGKRHDGGFECVMLDT